MSCWRPYILMLASLLMIVLLLASLNYFWQPCCCGSTFCCCRCDVPIVSATVGLLHAVAGLTVFARIPAFDGVHTVLATLFVFITPVACVPAVVSCNDIVVNLNVACCWRY
jgi:hypothetical protein